MFYECRKQGYDRINITSDNVDDQTGTFSYKFTQYPSTDFIFPPISISSTDAYVFISCGGYIRSRFSIPFPTFVADIETYASVLDIEIGGNIKSVEGY